MINKPKKDQQRFLKFYSWDEPLRCKNQLHAAECFFVTLELYPAHHIFLTYTWAKPGFLSVHAMLSQVVWALRLPGHFRYFIILKQVLWGKMSNNCSYSMILHIVSSWKPRKSHNMLNHAHHTRDISIWLHSFENCKFYANGYHIKY